ncbi:MAG: class I SAM-dependent methyltransferase [Pseudomonadota bacterium]
MAEHKNHLSRVYGLDTQEATDAFYSDWAETYDAEVIANGYQTPARAATALTVFAEPDARILDIGCGTGYSGYHFRQAGFRNVIGTDPNPDMLTIASQRGVYEETWLTDLASPFPFSPGTYDVIAAIGVISTGAAPPETLAAVLEHLLPGGLILFSYNDHALDEPAFPEARNAVLKAGLAVERFREYGPHLTGKDLKSDVYILERT